MTTLDPRWKWMRQLAAFAVLLLLWEAAGRIGLLNPLFVPSPSLIGRALYELFADGRVWPHIDATFTAALLGLALASWLGSCSESSPHYCRRSQNCSNR
jgi:NitT/TauT family transport system permease protein